MILGPFLFLPFIEPNGGLEKEMWGGSREK